MSREKTGQDTTVSERGARAPARKSLWFYATSNIGNHQSLCVRACPLSSVFGTALWVVRLPCPSSWLERLEVTLRGLCATSLARVSGN